MNAACESGTIKQLTLPTGGNIQWKHGAYELSTSECMDFDPNSTQPGRSLWSMSNIGVKERTFDPGQGALPGTWKYDPHLAPGEDIGPIRCGDHTYHGQPGPPQVFTNTVTTPSGNTVRYYFSGLNAEKRVGSYDGPNEARDYGLPFTRSESSGGFFLSSETLDAGGTILRKSYVRYEREEMVAGRPRWENRPAGKRTAYVLDRRCGSAGNEECYQQSLPSDFDGYGNYRKTIASSNFGPTRTTETNYNVTATGASRLIVPTEPWILNVHTRQTVTETTSEDVAPSVVAAEVCIDSSTGVVKGRRTLKDSARSATDVIVRYTYGDGRGNATTEDWYGGDHAPLQSNDLCSTAAAGPSEFQVIRSFQSGVLQRSRHRGMSHLDADYDVDLNTGFAKASREYTGVTIGAGGTEVFSPGVQTTFAYDRLSRPTAIFPPGQMETTYEYRPVTSNFPATVFMRHGASDGKGSKTSIEFDGLGRMRRKGELMPHPEHPLGLWSYRYTIYDGAGRVFQESEFGHPPESSLLRTTYIYDFFDNVKSVIHPDNSEVRTEYHGYGVREKARTVTRKLPGGPLAVVTTDLYDAFGRLVQIQEKSGPTSPAVPVGALVTTQYSYDAADRLRLVKMTGSDGAQTRVFDYDGRGFLRWEMQPESGMSSYTYDSRGNMRSRSVSEAESPYDLQFRYDPAGRLLEVAGRNPAYDASSPIPTQALRFRPVKTYDYATSNDTPVQGRPTDFGFGKLRTATRYNYPAAGTSPEIIKIVENLYYFHIGGRPTDRQTEIWSNKFSQLSFTKHRTVEFSQQYDAFGRPFTINYPIGVGAVVPADFPSDAPRAIRYDYQHGRLTRVSGADGGPDYASSITYHRNGLRDTITHGNGMADRQELDNTGMPRPRRLVTSPSATICTAPTIGVQPIGRKLNTASSVRLSVAAGGTAPLSYQWYDATSSMGNVIAGETNSYYDATKAGRYYVVVSNPCKRVQSQIVTVTTDSCTAPTVFAKREINKDGSVTLTATPSGVGAITCSWRRMPSGAPIGTGCSIVVSSSVGLDRVEVRATTDCDGLVGTRVLEPQPQLNYVTSLAAALSADRSHIAVTWPTVQNAARYLLKRYAAGGVTDTYLVTGTRYEDRSITAGAAYAYALVEGYTQDSARVDILSNADVASTLAFTPIIKGSTTVELRYFNELLDAVNAIRAVKGWPKLAWNSVMPPSVPVPAPGGLVYAFYLTSLRPRMDEVLHALGVPVAGYSNPDPKQVGITAEHMTEFQRRAQ
ncbi:MAG TPA: hypothetical protein VEK79_02625 [Thermoanaerobaculia bacterium]|nr:hypothetical protein [Thermoanaerobaculia bacterium]